MARVLITGMSGAGKSSVLQELARRGYRVVDTDYGDLSTSRGLFAGLSLFYGAFLLKAITEEGPPNYATYEEGPRRLFASHAGLLAGWAHYLAFDLFVGVWIYRTGLAEKTTTRLPLLLTFVAGPLGLLYFLLQRGLRRPMPYPFDRPKTKKDSGRFLPQKNQ